MCRTTSGSNHGSKSPVSHLDPLVRALNTVMYGLVVHFGTTWTIAQLNNSSEVDDICPNDRRKWWAVALLAHEYWVYLQHSNVFGNPLCQRLDRQYGIALLRSNQHWAIAGTLSAYWCRETFCMFLCLPLVSRYTQYLVLYSLVYHTIKSNGVRQDALRRYSPTFGIMRVVIDKFYHHTTTETIFSLVRLFLQGLDTFIHALIIADMVSSPLTGYGTMSMRHILFTIWVAHAAMNQFTRMSTASIMVHVWYALTATVSSPKVKKCSMIDVVDSSDDDTESESEPSISSSEDEDLDEGFEVRHLLRPGRVPEELKGKQGAASGGVDTAVRIETTVAIIAAINILAFADTPLKILVIESNTSDDIYGFSNLWMTIPYAWLLWSLLCAASHVFLRISKGKARQSAIGRKRTILYTIDVAIVVIGVSLANSSPAAKLLSLVLGLSVTAKSFLKSAKWRGPKIFWIATTILEIGLKALIGRWMVYQCEACFAFVGAVVCISWGVTNVFSGWLYSEEEDVETVSHAPNVADVVFLGHPAELSDCWALWLLPYSLDERWVRPWWAVPLWPFHYVVGYYTCNWRQRLFGDGASFFLGDDVTYEGVQMQTWVAAHFGRHFVTSRRAVKRNIEAAARHANEAGVKVLCLGALNKAEAINGGGVGVVRALGPDRNVSIIHGNHLTAAAVVETTHQCFGERAKVFLTGASSKTGWAVARALRDRFGYEVLCHSTDESRREVFRQYGFKAASTLFEGATYSNLWIVGKYDRAVADIMPQGGTAVVFAVPHPLESRKDIRVIEGGTLHVDESRLNRPRQFCNKLKGHEIFACHAASVVAAHRLKHGLQGDAESLDETGPVDPEKMDSWLDDAKTLGFRVPPALPVECNIATSSSLSDDRIAPVVIIGAGPAGLAVAASVRRKGIMSIVLDEQTDKDAFGSWDKHFSGLEITTQKHWCSLPGFAISDREFPGEYVTAEQYRRYLKIYAERFGIVVKRGYRAKSIVSGGKSARWIVECDGSDERFEASAVVDATGKNRIPQRDSRDKVTARLEEAQIDVVHSTDLSDEQTWEKVISAARHGKLCVVGFGNSAADICTAILQSYRKVEGKNDNAAIHVAVRTVPPVFPRRRGFLRIDSIGSVVRWMPNYIQEAMVRFLWWGMSDSGVCDKAFPAHLPRWHKINGRVPVVDKFGQLASAFRSGSMIGHGPIRTASTKSVTFFDSAGMVGESVSIDMAIMCTGYQKECIISREDRLNGLFLAGFSNDKFLPLKTIGEEAEGIARDISECIFR